MQPKINQLIEHGVDSFDTLLRTIADPTIDVTSKINAIWLVSQMGNKRGSPSLIKAFQLEDVSVAWESAIALGVLKSKGAVAPLVAELTSGLNQNKRAAAAYALGLIGDKTAEPPLIKLMLQPEVSSLVRSHVAEALGRLRSKKARDVLLKALADTSEEVVYSSVYALGEIGDKTSINGLEDFIRTNPDAPPRAKEEAMRILAS